MTEKTDLLNKSKNSQKPNNPEELKKLENSQSAEVQENPSAGQIFPIIVMVIMFIISIGFALVLAPIFVSLSFQADFSEFGGEQSLIIPLFYLVIILVFTAIILFITRKRKGRFIKYGFLAVICLSMIYVFAAIISAIFYPIPDQRWSDEVGVEDGVSAIMITDLDRDFDSEIIVGTNSGNVEVYNEDLDLLLSASFSTGLPITDFAVADLNNDSNLELIVLTNTISILEYLGEDIGFVSEWSDNDYYYSSITIIPNYPVEINSTIERRPVVVGSARSRNPNIEMKFLNVIGYTDKYSSLISMNDMIEFPYSVTSMEYEKFNSTSTPELYLSTDEGIYSITDLKPLTTNSTIKPVIVTTGLILGIIIEDIDNNGDSELIAWNHDGKVFIYEPDQLKPRWEKKVGSRIGGIAFGDVFESYKKNYKGHELVVSVDGRVYIYYSEDGFLNKAFEFTEETGRLDKQATGLAVGDLDGNDELDILVGSEKGLKHYQYQTFILSDMPCLIGLFISIILTIFLFKYPEWYLVDVVGIIVAGGVAALLGISIGLLPLIVLLIVLAIYDAISVYKTKHMVSLADKVMEFKLPILLVVPKKRGYSFLKQKGLKQQLEDGEEREAMFIGLGDIIIPGALVISAFHFLPVTGSYFGFTGNFLVAIFTLVGILIGFSVLMQYVLKGNPQAGLPLLNSGAILGFLISSFLIYQTSLVGLIIPFG